MWSRARSLASITDEDTRSGSIIPFFTRKTAEELNNSDGDPADNAPAVTNVTFGTDGNGNITRRLYQGRKRRSGNAVYLTKYDPQSQELGPWHPAPCAIWIPLREAEANGWGATETAAAWYDTNDDGKADTADEPSASPSTACAKSALQGERTSCWSSRKAR